MGRNGIGSRIEQKITDSETKIKDALKNVDSMELHFKDIQEKTGLSSRTITKRLKEMERKGEVTRVTRIGEKGHYWKLIDKKYFKKQVLMNKILNNLFREALIDAHETGEDQYLTIIHRYGELLFILSTMFEEEEMFDLTGFILVDFYRFAQQIKDEREIKDIQKDIIDEKNRLDKLSTEELENEVVKDTEEGLKDLEEWIKKLKEGD